MEWEEFEKKLNKWKGISKESSWLRAHSEPLLFKLFWRLKIPVKPPYFLNPFLFAAIAGTAFGSGMFLICTYLFAWLLNGLFLSWSTFVSIGAIFGVTVATYFYVEARIRKIPKWKDL